MKCVFCSYEWEPRAEKPKSCPRCKRYFPAAPPSSPSSSQSKTTMKKEKFEKESGKEIKFYFKSAKGL